MQNNYPNPCDKCSDVSCCQFAYGCREWQIRYRYRQKQINAYAKKILSDVDIREKFKYFHPDEFQTYIAKGPCKLCDNKERCETPCKLYWKWWDERMQIARKKALE